MQGDELTWAWSTARMAGRALTERDAGDLQRLLERCSAFVEMVEGAPPKANAALDLLRDLPPGGEAKDRLVLGVHAPAGEMIGVLTVVRGHPRPGVWWIGELIIEPSWRGNGLGAAIYQMLESWVRTQGATAIGLVVQEQNPGALRFWRKVGFVQVGTGVQAASRRQNQIIVMERTFTSRS